MIHSKLSNNVSKFLGNLFMILTGLKLKRKKIGNCSVADIADMVADMVATNAVLSICSGLTCLYSVRQITIYTDVN